VQTETVEAPPPPPEPPPEEVPVQQRRRRNPAAASAPQHLPENATPPVALSSNRPPEYPEEARRNAVEGTVIARVVVNERGEVEEVQVLRGDPIFRDAVIEALRQWRYEPAAADGVPIKVFHIVRLPFRLDV
jgi:protein TonB